MINKCKNLFLTIVLIMAGGMASAQLPINFSLMTDTLNRYREFNFKPELKELPYTRHQPFFCRQEEKIFKQTGINIKFRIGSYDYTEWMEKKPNSFFNYKN